jgi:hypothetical protein
MLTVRKQTRGHLEQRGETLVRSLLGAVSELAKVKVMHQILRMDDRDMFAISGEGVPEPRGVLRGRPSDQQRAERVVRNASISGDNL